MKRMLTLLAALGLACVAGGPVSAELRLLMFERTGCVYCVAWNRQIGPIYPLTPEGRAAPLRRIDLDTALPADLSLASRPRFTPTFVLARDGVELQRIEGYPGQDFFWALLGKMLESQPEWQVAAQEAPEVEG